MDESSKSMKEFMLNDGSPNQIDTSFPGIQNTIEPQYAIPFPEEYYYLVKSTS